MRPKVSVIIPLYKASDYIVRCARSLFEQTLDDLQYVFVDDCSPDNSVEKLENILAQYPHRKSQVLICRHELNKGVSVARNTGLAHADGEYIAFCDSDDFVDINMYRNLYAHAIQTDADAIMCDFYMYYSKDNIECVKTLPFNTNKEVFLKHYIAYNWTIVANIMVRKSVFDDYNIRFVERITYCEDFHLMFRLLYYSNRVSKLDEPLYYYNRSNEDSTMHKLSESAFIDERNVYLDLINFLEQDKTLDKYIKEFSWRILKNKQDLVLDCNKHDEFMSIFPISSKYIITCPLSFCNKKIKLLMWLLTHRCRLILLMLLALRNTKRK